MKKVISLSGGLDSTVLCYWLVDKYGAENILPITFDYGQKNSVETSKAKRTCCDLGLTYNLQDITFLGDICKDVSSLSASSDIETPDADDVADEVKPSTYIPYRNLIMLGIAMSYAESNKADTVFISSQIREIHWDSQQTFMEAMNRVSELNTTYPVKVEAPFIALSKADEIREGMKLNVPFEQCWSCYNPQFIQVPRTALACGSCSACDNRRKAFEEVGIDDPLPTIHGDLK